MRCDACLRLFCRSWRTDVHTASVDTSIWAALARHPPPSADHSLAGRRVGVQSEISCRKPSPAVHTTQVWLRPCVDSTAIVCDASCAAKYFPILLMCVRVILCDPKFSFGKQIYHRKVQFKSVYQGHRVKAKVMAAKSQKNASDVLCIYLRARLESTSLVFGAKYASYTSLVTSAVSPQKSNNYWIVLKCNSD